MEARLERPLENPTLLMPLRQCTVAREKPKDINNILVQPIACKILGCFVGLPHAWWKKNILAVAHGKELQRGVVDLRSFIGSQIPLRSFYLQKPLANCA